MTIRGGAPPIIESVVDPIVEGIGLAEALSEASVTARLFGGVAVATLCPSAQSIQPSRRYQDVDLVVSGSRGDLRGLDKTMLARGYVGDREMNTLRGHERRLYRHGSSGLPVDVFVDRVRMCHSLDFTKRLRIQPLTLPLADLLMLKLQVVQMNSKDIGDAMTIVADHPVTEDDRGISSRYISGLCQVDWRLWRTVTLTIERLRSFDSSPDVRLSAETRDVVRRRLDEIGNSIDSAPKGHRWRARARVGTRKRWYDLPEERSLA